MSSFKRKNPAKSKLQNYPGTRVSASTSATINVSTGISSLDDLLGGGLPLSCSLVIAAPDLHSSYGQLVQHYFLSEGLAAGHRVCLIDHDPGQFVKDTMWFSKSMLPKDTAPEGKEAVSDDEDQMQAGGKVKIAWRYEQMKQFQTTVATQNQTSDNYCHTFDLTNRISQRTIDEFRGGDTLSYFELNGKISSMCDEIEVYLQKNSSLPVRICIPSLGSPLGWGDVKGQDVLGFLTRLRTILRKHPHACASTTLSPHFSSDQWGGSGWLQKIGWVSDASLSMAAFAADPALSTMFPSHHGILRLFSLPSPHTLVPPSDKFSSLRGLASSSSAFGGTGENNLAFKCTRKRLVFETLHLDLEGGVSERRTSAPSSSSTSVTLETPSPAGNEDHGRAGAKIAIQLEGGDEAKPVVSGQTEAAMATTQPPEAKPKKAKKKVAFFSDRPEVYDF